MSIQAVSETMAFACSSTDWWNVIRGDPKRDLGIGGDDRTSFEAARTHVSNSTADLLLRCREAFKAKAGHPTRYQKLRTGILQTKTLAKNGWWELELIGASTKRSHLCVSLEADADGAIKLWASITGPELFLDWLQEKHPGARRFEGYCYGDPQSLGAGQTFEDVAERLADGWWPVVAAYCKHVSPGTRRKERAK